MLPTPESLSRLRAVQVMLSKNRNRINISLAEHIERWTSLRHLESLRLLRKLRNIKVTEDDFSDLRMRLKK